MHAVPSKNNSLCDEHTRFLIQECDTVFENNIAVRTSGISVYNNRNSKLVLISGTLKPMSLSDN